MHSLNNQSEVEKGDVSFMKKISCFLLMCILLIQLAPVGVQAAGESDTRRFEILTGIGILNNYTQETFDGDAFVSSGTFVNAVLNLIQDVETFSNIPTDRTVELAESLHILDGIDDFQRQRTITTGQALDIMVRSLGYKIFIESGKSPVAAASEIGISAAGGFASSPLTYDVMVDILYDSLEVHPLVFDGTSYAEDTGITVLEKFKEIRRIEGIVTQNSYTDLTTAPPLFGSHLIIGGVNCITDNGESDDLLGMYAEAYIKETDFGEKLVFARPWKNETFTLDRDRVVSVDDNYKVLSYEEKDKVEKLKISPTVKVIYNGIAYGQYVKSDFIADNGQIMLIDNNRDGVYDVVKITAYRTMVVKSFSSFDGVIANKYTYDKNNISVKLDLNDDDVENIIVKDGKVTTADSIKSGDVILISEPKSEDTRKTFIYVSSSVVEGYFTGITDDNIITVDDEEYALSDTYVMASADPVYTATSIGNYYKFYLDAFGRIAYIEEKSDDVIKYGYMVRMYHEEISDRYCVKMFSTDGEWYEYKLAKRVGYDKSRKSDFEVFSNLTDSNGKLRQAQVIRYKLNKNDEIRELDIAQTADGYDKNIFTKKTVTEKYRYENMSFLQQEIFLNKDTVVMIVPEDISDQNGYAAKDQSWIARDSEVTCTVYDLDEWNTTPLVVIVDNSSNKEKTLKNNDLCVVESVKPYIDSDEELCHKIVMHQPFYGKISLLSKETDTLSNVNPGDIIQVATDINSRVTAAQVLYSASEGEKKVWKASSEFYYATTLIAGEVIDVDADRRMLKMDCGETHFLTLAPTDYYREMDVVIYNRATDKIEVGSIQDIRPEDYIVADMSWYLISNLVIYR